MIETLKHYLSEQISYLRLDSDYDDYPEEHDSFYELADALSYWRCVDGYDAQGRDCVYLEYELPNHICEWLYSLGFQTATYRNAKGCGEFNEDCTCYVCCNDEGTEATRIWEFV